MRALVDNVERVVTGKRAVVELAVVTLAAGGHLLLEDVPGVGKTVLARALARSIDGGFARVQGAPDLLPADITGSSVWDQRLEAFRFVPGPVFANVLLVDELNRTTPRSQAALLEAMEEGQVSVDGTTHVLPHPHVVIATQNPLEHVGTFPLPESQLDRFTAAASLGYPDASQEAAIVRAQVRRHPLHDLTPVLTTSQVAELQRSVREVHVADELVDYAVRLTTATRTHPDVELGASPRASVQLVHAAQALAALRGRGFVLPDDVKELAGSVLPHRLVVRRGLGGDRPDPRGVVAGLLQQVAVEAPV
ncbi:MAG: MoxR family ATPase [Actinobacteria bacterium]|nr:MoxR family ATPase [Actinomycetota bacterium]